jgi:hypothetical protein
MENLTSQLAQILSNYTCTALRAIARKMNSNSNRKPEIITTLIAYILNQQNRNKLANLLPEQLYSELILILPDEDLSCICNQNTLNRPTVTCQSCSKKQHKNCISYFISTENYICPSCRVVKLNPAVEVIEFLIKPFIVADEQLQGQHRTFTMTKEIKDEIFVAANNIDLQLRCLNLTINQSGIMWPKQGNLYINERPIKEFKQNPSNGVKKKDSAIDISLLVSIGINSIGLTKRNDNSVYCLSLAKVRKLTKEEVFEKLSAGVLTELECKDFITNLLDCDNDLQPCMVSFPLKCPYSLQLINCPVRGKNCRHPNCFDLKHFIEFQEYENNTWKCPICKKSANEPYVDAFIIKILKSLDKTRELDRVEVSKDGKYEVFYFEAGEEATLKRSAPSVSPTNTVIEEVLISDSSSCNSVIIIDD